MDKKTKILFAAQNLSIGGVQKAFVNLLNETAKNENYDINVFVYSTGPLEKEIPGNINITYGNKILQLSSVSINDIKKSGNIFNILIRILITVFAKIIGSENFYRLFFKKQKEKYDIAISYFTDIPVGVFNKGTNLYVSDFVEADKKIAWIHTDPVSGGFDKAYCKRIYEPFDKIICVSDAVREKFNNLLPEYSFKTKTIYNKVNEEKINKLALLYEPFQKTNFDIVTVARIDNASKRIDGIIEICSRLKKEGITNFCWRIVGNGPDYESDKLLSENNHVSDVLIFEGEKSNPYPYIYKSDLFALYSAYEGYPVVIEEALALKTSVLTTNYAAAKEQIQSGYGIISMSDGDFYNNLKNLILRHN